MANALNFRCLLLGFIIIGVAYFANAGSSKSNEKKGENKYKAVVCEGDAEFYHLKQEDMKQITACKNTCRHFCQIKILNVINETGLADEAKYHQWVDETHPEKYKSFSHKHYTDCFRKYYDNKVDLSDKECKMADQFTDCAWGIVPHLKCGE